MWRVTLFYSSLKFLLLELQGLFYHLCWKNFTSLHKNTLGMSGLVLNFVIVVWVWTTGELTIIPVSTKSSISKYRSYRSQAKALLDISGLVLNLVIKINK